MVCLSVASGNNRRPNVAFIADAARAAHAEAELAVARAKASDDQALIAHQKLRPGSLPVVETSAA